MQQQSLRTHAKGVLASITAAVLAASLMVPSLAFAEPTSSEKQAEAQAALASLNAMQSKLDQASNDYFSAQQAQQEAEAKRDEAQSRIDQANDRISQLQDHLGTRIRSMYRTGNSTVLDLLLGSATFQAFASNWDLLNHINQDDADLVQQTKDLRAEVQEQQAVFEQEQRVAAEKAAEAKRVQDEAQATMSSMQATYDSLSAEAAALLESERAAQEAANAARAQQVVEESANNAGNNGGNNGGNEGNNEGNNNGNGGNSGPVYNPVTGNAVVDRALGCIGLPYGWGQCGPNAFDCSGLVSYAILGSFSRLGTTETFMGYPQVGDPQPGDICTSWGHCGIYIGGGQMVHAPDFGQTVCISAVQGDMIIVRPW